MQMLKTSLAVAALLVAGASVAAPVVYNTSLANISTFDTVITGTGATVITAAVSDSNPTGNVYSYIDAGGNNATVTVTRTGTGAAASTSGGYSSNGIDLSGDVWGISPESGTAGGGVGGLPDIDGYGSGLTFTFSSAVNAFGFEIGDWATCCTANVRSAAVQSAYSVPATGSGLWIAFDGGAATLPANALTANDNPGFAGGGGSYTNFIGAIDSSSTFSKVTFWGDGYGEFLVAGGTLRFASVPKGSVGLPEPGSLALVGLALAGLAAASRRKSA
jgi:hypothetical protein